MIPDHILELAARAAAKDEDASNWGDEPEHYRNGWINRIAPALEAAAPHMLTRAWDEGHANGFDLARGVIDPSPNPYRSQS